MIIKQARTKLQRPVDTSQVCGSRAEAFNAVLGSSELSLVRNLDERSHPQG